MTNNSASDLIEHLRRGVLPAGELAQRLGVSRATLGRRLAEVSDQVAVLGRGRATSYGLYAAVLAGQQTLPVHRINANGRSMHMGDLTPFVAASGTAYWFNDLSTPSNSQLYDDLPWFLFDMRPQGFMGRTFANQNPALGLGGRLQDWTSAQITTALALRGADVIGDLILGSESYGRWAEQAANPTAPIPSAQVLRRFGELANEAMAGQPAGSSAGGEQAKFGAVIADENGAPRHTLVKFSPIINSEAARRWADLLIAESIAASVLSSIGCPAAHSEILQDDARVYLIVDRFDRIGTRGRRGVVSLAAVDAQFVGQGSGWVSIAESLVRQRLLSANDLSRVRFLQAFGQLIANTDRHSGNLSLQLDNINGPYRLAPSYDMLPMFYAPNQDGVPERRFTIPSGAEVPAEWSAALPIATQYWRTVAARVEVSDGFRRIAQGNAQLLSTQEPLTDPAPIGWQ